MKLFILSLFLSLNFAASAQEEFYDPRNAKLKFGFLTAINLASTPSISAKGTGFSFGITAEYRLASKMYFYPRPMMSSISMHTKNTRIETTNLEVPLHVLFKPFDCPYFPHISFGPNYKTSLAKTTTPGEWSMDVALGFEQHLPYFILTPEFCYSWNKTMQTVYLMVHFKG